MAVQYKDYYETLGVPRSASVADIKKSFRKLAREYHPDVAMDKKRAEEKFKEINEAYEVLSDPEKRKKYDELGANSKSGAEFRPPPGWENFGRQQTFRGGRPGTNAGPNAEEFEFQFGGTGFSDFFEQLFGSSRGRRGGFSGFSNMHGEDAAERGRDVEGDILVTLEEAAHGAVRTVTVRHESNAETHQVKIPAGVAEGATFAAGRTRGRRACGSGGGCGSGDLYSCEYGWRGPSRL